MSSCSSSAVIEMVTGNKLPYQRLQHEGGFDDEEDRLRSYSRSSSFRFRRVHIRRRLRLRVPSLRRFMMRRVRLVSAVRGSCRKVIKRLKESRAHFGDLFAGNYLFLQVGPTPIKCHDKYSFCNNNYNGLSGLASTHSLQRIA